MKNFIAIYRILRYLEQSMDNDETDMDGVSAEKLGLTDNRWASILDMLIKNGYISGIEVEWSSDGDALLSAYDPGITLQGLEYLEGDSMMVTIREIAAGAAGDAGEGTCRPHEETEEEG